MADEHPENENAKVSDGAAGADEPMAADKPKLSIVKELEPPAEDPKDVAAREAAAKARAEAEAAVCDASARVVKALQSEGGLGRAAACLMAAHIFLVECGGDMAKMSALGGTEVGDYARGFQRLHHAPSVSLREANSQEFHDRLMTEKLATASAQELLEVSAVLRRANP